jgi:hypothetical protein
MRQKVAGRRQRAWAATVTMTPRFVDWVPVVAEQSTTSAGANGFFYQFVFRTAGGVHEPSVISTFGR